jgi:hypothetical protein
MPTEARAKVSIQININTQPIWGPVGYDYAQFYYFPDYNFYYDINRAQYLILNNNRWMYTKSVPTAYRFNPYTSYKVVINEQAPFQNNSRHLRLYAQYKGKGRQQQLIRDSRDSRYYGNQGHPMYGKNQNNGNNNRQQGMVNNRANNKGKTTGGAR